MSMTGYCDAYKLDIPMQWPMAMATAMMSRERKPPSMPPSQDEAHTTIEDFTESTVSNSDNDLHLVQVTSARLDSRMPDISEVETWRTLSLWMFLFFSSLNSLILWISAQYKWRRLRFLPPPETSQVEVEFPRVPDLPNGYHMVLIGCGTYGFVHLRTLTGCLIVSFLLLYRYMQPRGSGPNERDNVTARLYVTCPGPGNTRFIYSRVATSLRSLAIILPYLP